MRDTIIKVIRVRQLSMIPGWQHSDCVTSTRRHLQTLALLFSAILLLSSCAPRILIPPAAPLQLREIDTTTLQGKRIVIDPGHGGVFTGAVGLQGIRESDVNLAVALNLWGLLHEAGADPVLTRSADVSMLATQDRDLRSDLQERVTRSQQQEPDLFLSVHHNSDIHHPDRNETEIYYQLTNPAASRNLADAVGRAFQSRMGTQDVRVLPGNFYVLRKSPFTAVLGEGSFVSNNGNEKRIAVSAYQRLEAEAYFLGILDYFRRGVPRVTYQNPPDTPGRMERADGSSPSGQGTLESGPTVPKAVPIWSEGSPLAATLADAGGGGIDPATVQAWIDDRPVPYDYDPEKGRVTAKITSPLTNGDHAFRVEASNRNGQWTPRLSVPFRVDRPAAAIEVIVAFPVIPADAQTLSRVRIRVTDPMGFPVSDATSVKLSLSGDTLRDSLRGSPNRLGELLNQTLETKQGEATGFIRAGIGSGVATLLVVSGEVEAVKEIVFGEPEEALLIGEVRDKRGRPVDGVALWEGDVLLDRSDGEGYLFYRGLSGDHSLTLRRNGYHPQVVTAALRKGRADVSRWEIVPVEEGILMGKKVVISYEEEDDASAKRILPSLIERLEMAGARVYVLDPLQDPSVEERTLLANHTDADLLIALEGDKTRDAIGYYYSSTEGKRLAVSLGATLGLMAQESSHFLVVHTGMPAVVIPVASSLGPDEASQAIYKGLLTYFQ